MTLVAGIFGAVLLVVSVGVMILAAAIGEYGLFSDAWPLALVGLVLVVVSIATGRD